MKHWLTVAEAAALLGMAPASVRRLASTGKLTIRRIDGRTYQIAAPSVAHYLVEHRQPGKSGWTR